MIPRAPPAGQAGFMALVVTVFVTHVTASRPQSKAAYTRQTRTGRWPSTDAVSEADTSPKGDAGRTH
jgi:hypothetical protein